MDAVGVERTRIERGRRRMLATVFGKVTVPRIAYRGTRVADLHPADAVLNPPDGMHSHELARLAAIESSRGRFADACERINAVTGAGVGHRQVQELAVDAAARHRRLLRRPRAAPCTDDTPLTLSVDGKGMVIKARSAARGHRQSCRGRQHDEDPAGGRGETRQEADGHSGGCLRRRARAAQAPERRPGPKAKVKWLCGSVNDTAAEVVATVFDKVEHRDPGHRRCWIVLVDGAHYQIDSIKTEAQQRGADIHIIVDVIHVLEYLWRAAWCLHSSGTGDASAEAWVARHARTS
ncbi:hypothetical protein ABZ070_29970 [Streptomyces sp. NPDC006283]|uniref:hypothetical protein n=1 Tax=Streptomyces sp. NPDC006283 TaxID=3156741 RepID=UPI0033B3DB40